MPSPSRGAPAPVIPLPSSSNILPHPRHRGHLPKSVTSLKAVRDRRRLARSQAVSLFNRMLDLVEESVHEALSEKIAAMRMRP